MVSDMEKSRPNNRMLVRRNQNFSEMMVCNMSGRAFHQYDILQ